MATVSKGYTFGSTEQVTHTKLHLLVDAAAVTDIVNADVASASAIIGTKIDLSQVGMIGETSTSAARFKALTASGYTQIDGGDFLWNDAGASGYSARFEGGSDGNLMVLFTDTDKVIFGASATLASASKVEVCGDLSISHSATGSASFLKLWEGANHVGFTVPSALATTYTYMFPSAVGEAGQMLEADGASGFRWGNLAAEYTSAASNFTLMDNAGTTVCPNTAVDEYDKTKEAWMDKGGSVLVEFQVRAEGLSNRDTSGKIYVNDVEYSGVVTTSTDDTWESHSEVVSGLAQLDKVQVWGASELVGEPAEIKEFVISGDRPGNPMINNDYN